jgi:hypothetical protein
MRTKTALLTAAALAAGLAGASAQVYSQNIVGYVNVTFTNGFTMFGNPLHTDSTGTNDTVQQIFGTNMPNGSTIYAFSGGAFANPAAGYTTKGGWTGGTNAANAALSAGRGVFIKVPSTATLTFVGNVVAGGTNTVPYNNGFNIVSSPTPQAGLLQTNLGFVPFNGDTIYQFNSSSQAYPNPSSGYTTKGGWAGAGQPNLQVGEAFWLKSASVSGGTWVQVFNP